MRLRDVRGGPSNRPPLARRILVAVAARIVKQRRCGPVLKKTCLFGICDLDKVQHSLCATTRWDSHMLLANLSEDQRLTEFHIVGWIGDVISPFVDLRIDGKFKVLGCIVPKPLLIYTRRGIQTKKVRADEYGCSEQDNTTRTMQAVITECLRGTEERSLLSLDG